MHWSRVSADIYYTQTAPEPADVLAAMVEAKDVAKALDAYEPHTAGYLALKAKLAEIRAGKGDAKKTPIANGAGAEGRRPGRPGAAAARTAQASQATAPPSTRRWPTR